MQAEQAILGLNDARIDKFEIILADPPWTYAHSRSSKRAIERHYPTLTNGQIGALPVEDLAAADSLLFLWATAPLLQHALEVLNAWGFSYTTNAVWDKVLRGLGYHFRGQHEHLLVGKRGEPKPPQEHRRIGSVIRSKRGPHSRKPAEVHRHIERAFPSARKLELFARQPRRGWSVWGNEVACDVELPDPALTGPVIVQTELGLTRNTPTNGYTTSYAAGRSLGLRSGPGMVEIATGEVSPLTDQGVSHRAMELSAKAEKWVTKSEGVSVGFRPASQDSHGVK